MIYRKALAVFLAAILALATLSSCRAQEEGQEMPSGNALETTVSETVTNFEDPIRLDVVEYPETNPDAFPYYLDLLITTTDATATSATLKFYHPDGFPAGTMVTTSWLAIESRVDWETWQSVMPHPDADSNVPLTETVIEKRDGFEMTVDWSNLYGTLEPGSYRIVKYIEYTRPDTEDTLSFFGYAGLVVEAEPFLGRGLTLADVPAEDMPISNPPSDRDAKLIVENVTPFGIDVRYVTLDGTENVNASIGRSYSLERYNGAMWSMVPAYRPLIFTEEGVIMFPGRESHSWSYAYGELAPGVYRYVKQVFGGEYYAYFEIPQ